MKHKLDKNTGKNQKPSRSMLEKMGFTVSGSWAKRGILSIYLPTLTHQKLVDDIYSQAFDFGKQNKLNEIKKTLEI